MISFDDVVAWIRTLRRRSSRRTRSTSRSSTPRSATPTTASTWTAASGRARRSCDGLPGRRRRRGASSPSASTLISTVGGASGPLYGTFFLQFGMAPRRPAMPSASSELADGASTPGIGGIQRLGKAEPGDKTMVDALMPARDALRGRARRRRVRRTTLARTVAAAEQGMLATIPLVARKGRASYLGERSAGHQDPGATSSYLLLRRPQPTRGPGAETRHMRYRARLAVAGDTHGEDTSAPSTRARRAPAS